MQEKFGLPHRRTGPVTSGWGIRALYRAVPTVSLKLRDASLWRVDPSTLKVPRWLPNAISFARVLLVPVWACCAELAQRAAEAGEDPLPGLRAAGLVLLAIGASDVLDGWLARRFSLQSARGAMIDAVADKLTQVVLTTYLALRTGPAFAAIPLWFLLLLIARDGLLLAGSATIRHRRGHLEAEHALHGKLASVALFAVLLAFSFGVSLTLSAPLLWGTAALVVASTAMYVRHGVRQYANPPSAP